MNLNLTQEQKKELAKKKKNRFVRQDINKKSRLEKKWHYPKGVHSKLRHRKRGYGLVVKTGYKTPKKFRGRTLEGYQILTVKTLDELNKLSRLNDNTIKVQIASKIGDRKRLVLLNMISKLKLNYYGNIDEDIKKITSTKEKKEEKEKKEGEETVSKEETKEKKEKTKEAENKKEPEEVEEKVKEKKEFDKLLSKGR